MSADGVARRADYRPDIDGLRAIAVLIVVAFHADVPWLSGGYLGVDVFFVISGYLITTILHNAFAAGRFSYLDFAARRGRRLIPAVVPVLLFVAVVVLLIRPPAEVRDFAKSISHVALLISDWYYFERIGYFGPDAKTLPFLHFWSLAVEAKFYLVFPLILWLIWRFAADGARTQVALWVLAILTVVSFAACLLVGPGLPTATFFLAPFRAWELLAGGLLALAPIAAPAVMARVMSAARPVATPLGLLALAAILVPSVVYTAGTPHPGWATAPPVLGTLVLLALGAPPPADSAETAPAIARWLGAAPLRFIGLISYSLYLWHWPLLVLGRDVAMGPLTEWQTAGIVALSFALAVASYRLVERPFRRRPSVPETAGLLRRNGFGVAAGGVAVAVLAIGGVLQKVDGWPQRFSADHVAIFDHKLGRSGADAFYCDALRPEEAAQLSGLTDVVDCRIGSADGPLRVAVLGDSHANSVGVAAHRILSEAGLSGVVITHGACLPTFDLAHCRSRAHLPCFTQNQNAPQVMAALGIDVVLMVGSWEPYLADADEFAEVSASLERSIARLRDDGMSMILATPIPTLDYAAPRRLFIGHALGVAPPPHLPLTDYLERNAPLFALFERLAAAPDVSLIDQHRAVCDDQLCFGYRLLGDGIAPQPFYADNNHVNVMRFLEEANVLRPVAELAVERLAADAEGSRAGSD